MGGGPIKPTNNEKTRNRNKNNEKSNFRNWIGSSTSIMW